MVADRPVCIVEAVGAPNMVAELVDPFEPRDRLQPWAHRIRCLIALLVDMDREQGFLRGVVGRVGRKPPAEIAREPHPDFAHQALISRVVTALGGRHQAVPAIVYRINNCCLPALPLLLLSRTLFGPWSAGRVCGASSTAAGGSAALLRDVGKCEVIRVLW